MSRLFPISVKTWQLSLIFSRNVDGCGTMLSNKQDFSCGDFVAADGYSKAQMVTGLKPTRYPLFSTWESGNSWPGNDLFPEQLSLDNWMCVCERETEKGRERERICVWVHGWLCKWKCLRTGVWMRVCANACEHVCLHVSMCVFIMYVSSCPAEN